MTTLFALTDQYRQLNALAESDIEIDEQTLADTLEALGGELQDKASNVARFIVNQDVMAEAIDNAAKAMKERAARLRRRNDWLKAYLLVNMEASGITRIESPEMVVAIRKNPPRVEVYDQDEVPGQYMIQPPLPALVPDKAAIKAALASGEDVPGCRLEQGRRVEIKI